MNPGSEEAVKEGCICARMDNSYGKGYRHYEGKKKPSFVITEGCPLHWTHSHARRVEEAYKDKVYYG